MQIRVNAPKNTISSRSNIRSPKFFFFFSFILGSSPYIIDLANTIECAKIEFESNDFNHDKYRKLIFDAHTIIDKIGDNHE